MKIYFFNDIFNEAIYKTKHMSIIKKYENKKSVNNVRKEVKELSVFRCSREFIKMPLI